MLLALSPLSFPSVVTCLPHSLSTSFLSSSRRLLHCSSPAGSGVGEPSEGPSGSPSPRPDSSQGYSNVPSPEEGSSGARNHQTWAHDSDHSPRGPVALQSAPSPAALQDTSSQDTQSSGSTTHPQQSGWMLQMLLYFSFIVCHVHVEAYLFYFAHFIL